MNTMTLNTSDNDAARPEATQEDKSKSKRGQTKGKSWSWSKLKTGAVVTSEAHLACRYLVEVGGHTAATLAEMCGCDVAQAQKMIYGRLSRREARKNLDIIAKLQGTSYEELAERATAWSKAGTVEHMIIHIRSLHESSEHYGFQHGWLEKNNLRADMLVVVKQDTNLLESENIQKGDALLVNTENTDFAAGAFYAAEIEGTVCIGMATMQHGKRYFSVDPSGKKWSPEAFDALLKKKKILGRCVWRSSLM